MKITFTFLLQVFIMVCAVAQVPSTEIFLVSLNKENGKMVFGKPINISNNPGYDNQPSFSPGNDRLLYTSMRDSVQTDIYAYTIAEKQTAPLGITPESEYSPVFLFEGKGISVVRVDTDKGQRLYEFNENPAETTLLVDGIDSVGYYCQVNDTIIALAVLNNGMDLYLYETTTTQFIIGAKGIGRCLLRNPVTGELIFTIKSPDGKVSLMKFDIEKGIKEHFCDGLEGVDDYIFTPDGDLWAGLNGKLFSFNSNLKSDWEQIADFSQSAGSFYRMAISSDGKYLALVVYEGDRP